MQTIRKNVRTAFVFMHVVIQDFKQIIIKWSNILLPHHPRLNITYHLVIETLYTWI